MFSNNFFPNLLVTHQYDPTWAHQIFLNEGAVLADILFTGELREDVGAFICGPQNMVYAKLFKLVDQALGDVVVFLQERLFSLELSVDLFCHQLGVTLALKLVVPELLCQFELGDEGFVFDLVVGCFKSKTDSLL